MKLFKAIKGVGIQIGYSHCLYGKKLNKKQSPVKPYLLQGFRLSTKGIKKLTLDAFCHFTSEYFSDIQIRNAGEELHLNYANQALKTAVED